MLFCVPGVAAGEYDIRSIDLQIAFLARGHIAFLARGHIDLQLQFSLSILCTSGYN